MSTTQQQEVQPLSEAAAAFVAGPHGLLIGDGWTAAADGRTFSTHDPSTAAAICDVALAGPEDVARAVTAARAALEGAWREVTPAECARLMLRLADLLESRAGLLAEIEALDNGKPVRMARVVDVPLAVEQLRYYAGWPTKITGDTLPVSAPGMHVYTRREPVGVCAQIVPWNFPLYTAVQKVAPAVAAGCTVVLKPAEQTPLTALMLGRLVQEAGFPPGVVNVLTGDGTTGAALVDHPGVDKIAFTGSTSVGREIGVKAAQAFKRVTLELGGKSPSIVLPDADVEQTARGAYQAMYFNTGQVCQAGTRLFVHRDQHDELVAALAERASKARVGPGLAPDTQLGPVVSAEQHERVLQYIRSGIEEGAKLVVGHGGEANAGRGWFVRPSLFTGVDDDMAIAREEIFGPVLVAMPYDDLDEVARRANASEYGLAAYVWTGDLAAGHRLAAKLQAGSVFVNTVTMNDPAAPFGGFKSSGIGREGGEANLDAYLETKTVWTRIG
ncbi:MAG: aldehyde dehydrogenase family protein [Thermoleophilaceae bacterium]